MAGTDDKRGKWPFKTIGGVTYWYSPSAEGRLPESEVTLVGDIIHGQEVTLQSGGLFGNRENVKPLYVNDGSSKLGTSLGRQQVDMHSSVVSVDNDFTNGQLSQSLRFDVHSSSSNAYYTSPLFDPDKPLIQYVERCYDKDITDPANQASGDYNLKTNRFYGGISSSGGSNRQNFYIGYQGSEGVNSARVGHEYVPQGSWSGSKAYPAGVPARSWLGEEYVFINSASPGNASGRIYHSRGGKLLNVDSQDHTIITYDQDWPNKVNMDYGDQWSNSTSATGPQYIWKGLHIRDDEWLSVYVGNSSTLSSCTELVRLPQTEWTSSQVKAIYYNTRVSPESAYFYVRVGFDSWISNEGVR